MGATEGPTELVAERVRLRTLAPPDFVALGQDPVAFAGDLGLACAPEWPAPVIRQRFAEGPRELPDDPRFGFWIVIEEAQRTIVGDVGFHGPPDAAGSVEVGYALAPGWRGRGYATEAVGRLCAWAQGEGGARAVTARIRPDNEASARVVARLGFERVGAADGYEVWRRGERSALD